MGQIYSKATSLGNDKTIILGPGDNLIRRFALGSWTRLRLVAFVSLTHTSGPDVDNSEIWEVRNNTGPDTRLYIGIKNGDNLVVPGNPDTYFWGLTNVNSQNLSLRAGGNNPANATLPTSAGNFNQAGWGCIDGATLAGVVTGTSGYAPLGKRANIEAATAFAGLVWMEFEIAGSTVTIRPPNFSTGGMPDITDVSFGNLLTYFDSNRHPSTLLANAVDPGSVALSSPPDAVFFRWPMLQSQLRIHAMGVKAFYD